MPNLKPTLGLALAGVLAAAVGPSALAEGGGITDPAGDFPDIRRLDYNNAQTKVVLTMKLASLADAQNQSFYIQWGAPKKYQVFHSPGVGITELRFFRDADTFRSVDCAGLRVTENDTAQTTKATVPRSCIGKAPDTLRFKAIATQGTSLSDETKLTPAARRG